ncbi:MAG: urea ABC transporter permease subunit UrtB [Sphingobacteriia bacterium]|nr:urea ABC transporter permease subunit UrtB [Sphingobacteriia bacterium]NCC41029.1 urea ABC transporter permease subunit UrtB [Gammaproteobacteria bacterium]
MTHPHHPRLARWLCTLILILGAGPVASADPLQPAGLESDEARTPAVLDSAAAPATLTLVPGEQDAAAADPHSLTPETLAVSEPAPVLDFAALVARLPEGSFRERAAIAVSIAETGDPRAVEVLGALLEGQLEVSRETPPRILIRTADTQVDALSGEVWSESVQTARVPVNSPLRGQLRALIARLNLSHPETRVRLDAVDRLMTSGSAAPLVDLLGARLLVEEDAAVREAIQVTLAMVDLQAGDAQQRLGAIAVLRGALAPEVRAAVTRVAEIDPDEQVRAAAGEALDSIQRRLQWYGFLENLFFGLSLGSVLLLAAVGLAITFGVMGVINMAHGELIMIGAYTTWLIQLALPQHLEYSVLIAIPAAFMVAGLVGIAIERGVIRFLYGRPLETLLATFGISLILQQAVRSLFSPLNRAVASPDWLSGSLQINPVLSITYGRLYILVFSLMVFVALLIVLKRTDLGLKVRAVSQNRAMARALGVRAGWVDALTFGLGAGIAGVAGVALSQLTNVGPNLGQSYIIDSFMVVVFGGVGNLWGTLVGAMGLGVLNKFMEPYLGAVLAKILVLIFIILFIQKRPRGLFPQKGRAAET